jgi:hypothetical protein
MSDWNGPDRPRPRWGLIALMMAVVVGFAFYWSWKVHFGGAPLASLNKPPAETAAAPPPTR